MNTLFERATDLVQPDLFTDDERPTIIDWDKNVRPRGKDRNITYEVKTIEGDYHIIHVAIRFHILRMDSVWSLDISFQNRNQQMSTSMVASGIAVTSHITPTANKAEWLRHQLAYNEKAALPDELIEDIVASILDHIRSN